MTQAARPSVGQALPQAASAARPIALLTGGTSGMGLALARRLSSRADLVIVGRRPLEAVADALPTHVLYLQADMAQPSEAAAAVTAGLARHGVERLDLAVLAAGTGVYGDPAIEGAASIRRTLAVNLGAPLALAHGLAPHLQASGRPDGGRLVLIGSVARRGSAPLATYAASKAGLDGLARALREEWRGQIAVSMLHPGPTATKMHREAGFDPGRMVRLFASPERMAALIERAIDDGKTFAALGSAATLRHKLGHWTFP